MNNHEQYIFTACVNVLTTNVNKLVLVVKQYEEVMTLFFTQKVIYKYLQISNHI